LVQGLLEIVFGVVLVLLEPFQQKRRPVARDALALLVMIAIPLAWFIPAVILGGHAYARDVVVKQTVGRAFSSWVHQAPPWFYIERLPLTLFPWFFLALASAVALWGPPPLLLHSVFAVLRP